MNGETTDLTLSPEFFRGQSYLGKPTTISLVGQEPGGPASTLAAGGITAPSTAPGGLALAPPGKLAGGGGGITGDLTDVTTAGGGRGGGILSDLRLALSGIEKGSAAARLVASLLPGAPSHARSPESESAFQAQRAGERDPEAATTLAAGEAAAVPGRELLEAGGVFGEVAPAAPGLSLPSLVGPALGIAKSGLDFAQGQIGAGAADLAAAALSFTPAAPFAPFVALAGGAFAPNMAKREQHLQFKADVQRAGQEFGALDAAARAFAGVPALTTESLQGIPSPDVTRLAQTGLETLRLPFGSAFGRATSGDVPGGTAAIDTRKQAMFDIMLKTFAAQDELVRRGEPMAPWGFAENGVQSVDVNTLLSPIVTGFGTPMGRAQFDVQGGGRILGGKLLRTYPTRPGHLVEDVQTILRGETPPAGPLTWPITLLDQDAEGNQVIRTASMTATGIQRPPAQLEAGAPLDFAGDLLPVGSA